MKTASSPSSDSARESVHSENDPGRKSSSFSKVFGYSLLTFFFLQVVIGTVVIVLFVGSEMTKLQENSVRSELKGRSQQLVAYLNDRLLILGDYSELPILIAGVMQPNEHLANTVDFIESLPFLKSDVYFSLRDFQGNIIYSKWNIPASESVDSFKDLMDGRSDGTVEVVVPDTAYQSQSFWKLSVPVKYRGFAEGVLSAYFPVQLNTIFPEVRDSARITLEVDGKPVASMGDAPDLAIEVESEIGFPGFLLKQGVSSGIVNKRIIRLIVFMLLALVVGTGVLLLIVQRVGKKLLLVPHEHLQEMRDQLESEVEKRTADLKMRTVQLSIEIRERREAEIEARESGKLIAALLEGIGAAFFIVNPKTNTIIRSNSVVHEMFGLAPWQISKRSCESLFSGLSNSMPDLMCPDSIGTNKYMEGVAYHADGTTFPASRYLVPMEIQGEEHIGVIILDITDRKNLERRLNVAQKLESVGELASGIAHEINTPIQYVGDSIRFVQEAVGDLVEILKAQSEVVGKCREAGVHRDMIERIEELEDDADLEFVLEEIPKACSRALDGTQRVANIVRAMKNFAHPGTGEMVAVDINQALENTIIVSKNEWKYVADVEKDFDPLPTIQCLPGDINQVLLNIMVNAAHAIADVVGNSGEKGTITIATRANDDSVTVRISDTGTGIPEDVRNKIFDPFFTTKEVGRGTGQGLAIVHDIVVERHGGSIDIESEVGEGTTFIVTLPLENS